MKQERWFERYAWLWFAVLSGAVIPLALVVYINPPAAIDLWARFGYELPAAIAGDEASLGYVEFISHWASTGTIGFDLFALAVAVTAFRRGERWAWLVFWYWAVLFVTHFFTYQSDFRYLQLLWLVITLLVLAATFKRAWRRHAEHDVVAGDVR
ncbi:MAG: hypothetical protein M3N29_06645 [Chloroflexota bacterium]|nr:hypothetical protein [Chloroflexota bacterium]